MTSDNDLGAHWLTSGRTWTVNDTGVPEPVLGPVFDPVVPPGAFFLTTIDGWTGRWVAAAQAFVRGRSTYTHAGLILDHGQMIEALPGGARITRIEKLLDYAADGKPLLICDAPVQRYLKGKGSPGAEQQIRTEIASKARYLEGVPYSFLDYAALAMAEWKLPGWQLVRDRVESSQHLICSALCDRAYSWSGIHLFDDGRLPGDVTPGDLADWAEAHR